MEENRGDLPTKLPSSRIELKPKWKLAKLAWILPISSVLVLLLLLMVLDNERFGLRHIAGGRLETLGLGMVLFVTAASQVCYVGGLVFTTLNFVFVRKYSNTLLHAIAGCVTLVAIPLLGVAAWILMVLSMGSSDWR